MHTQFHLVVLVFSYATNSSSSSELLEGPRFPTAELGPLKFTILPVLPAPDAAFKTSSIASSCMCSSSSVISRISCGFNEYARPLRSSADRDRDFTWSMECFYRLRQKVSVPVFIKRAWPRAPLRKFIWSKALSEILSARSHELNGMTKLLHNEAPLGCRSGTTLVISWLAFISFDIFPSSFHFDVSRICKIVNY